jgi:hypothetical protein
MEYLHQNTDIPISRVYSWGLLAESPQHLGPFIIMDYVNGTLLSSILKQPDQDGMVLSPNIDNTTLDKTIIKSPIIWSSLFNFRLPVSGPSRRTMLSVHGMLPEDP